MELEWKHKQVDTSNKMKSNEFSFYYEINERSYRLVILKITSNGVYFRDFLQNAERHTSYHRDGRYHSVYTSLKEGRKRFLPQKKSCKPPINRISDFVTVETRGATYTNPTFMETYVPRTGDIKLFDRIQVTDNTNMFLLIGPNISTFASRLPPNVQVKESEYHSVEYLQTRAHIILMNFEM